LVTAHRSDRELAARRDSVPYRPAPTDPTQDFHRRPLPFGRKKCEARRAGLSEAGSGGITARRPSWIASCARRGVRRLHRRNPDRMNRHAKGNRTMSTKDIDETRDESSSERSSTSGDSKTMRQLREKASSAGQEIRELGGLAKDVASEKLAEVRDAAVDKVAQGREQVSKFFG